MATFKAEVIHSTPKAILLKIEGSTTQEWFPRSTVYRTHDLPHMSSRWGIFNIAAWIINQKGLGRLSYRFEEHPNEKVLLVGA